MIDEGLVLHLLAAKDNRAYHYLYSVYYTALRNLAIHYVKDDQVANDLVQEVFISLLESTHEFHDLNDVKCFLYSALKNRCISHYRKQQVRNKYHQEVLSTPEEYEDYWKNVLEEDVYANLMRAIDTLPPQCRFVMQLSLEGLKISEIASKMNISVETVKEHKKNGKQKLFKLLNNPFLCTLVVYL